MSPFSPPETYHQDEVQEILQLAIANQAKSGELSRSQLFEIADELGLSHQDIRKAEQEWMGTHSVEQEKQAFMRWRQVQFHQHSVKYLIVNGFLVILDLVSFGDTASVGISVFGGVLSWSLFIMLIWGLFLALDGWQSRQTEGRSFERKFRKWQRRQWLTQSFRNLFRQFFRTT